MKLLLLSTGKLDPQAMQRLSHLEDDDHFPQRRTILVKRSKSLNGAIESSPLKKEPRSNPTSPKRVHFADADGQSLVEVKNFFSNDLSDFVRQFNHNGQVKPMLAKPMLVKSWSAPALIFENNSGKLTLPCFSLKPCFRLPESYDLVSRVSSNNVCLENVMTDARILTVSCRVKNLTYHKSISVRFTFDKWNSFTETHGNHIHHSVDGKTDRFDVVIHVPKRVRRMEFAVKYETAGMEFWDNNACKNYVVENST